MQFSFFVFVLSVVLVCSAGSEGSSDRLQHEWNCLSISAWLTNLGSFVGAEGTAVYPANLIILYLPYSLCCFCDYCPHTGSYPADQISQAWGSEMYTFLCMII